MNALTCGSCTACSANAVNIILRVKRHIKVDYRVNALDQYTAHDISCNKNLNGATTESLSALARALRRCACITSTRPAALPRFLSKILSTRDFHHRTPNALWLRSTVDKCGAAVFVPEVTGVNVARLLPQFVPFLQSRCALDLQAAHLWLSN